MYLGLYCEWNSEHQRHTYWIKMAGTSMSTEGFSTQRFDNNNSSSDRGIMVYEGMIRDDGGRSNYCLANIVVLWWLIRPPLKIVTW